MKWGVDDLLWMADLVLVFVAALSEDGTRFVDVEDDCSEEWSEKCFEGRSAQYSEEVQCGRFVVVR